MKDLIAASLVILIASTKARHVQDGVDTSNFLSKGGNALTINLLQSDSKNEGNTVFSPLGYNCILALLAEGARGETRSQLIKALNHPEDNNVVRSVYKNILTSMKEHGVLNQPELKSWFYVYKNNSVDEQYKTILKENYLIDIKEVDRYSNMDEHDEVKQVDDDSALKNGTEKIEEQPSKNEIVKDEEETINKINADEEETTSTMNESSMIEDTTTEGLQTNQVDDKWETPEIGSPRHKRMDLEDIIARSLKYEINANKEMVSALSANRLSSLGPGVRPSSRMIVFNALYFRGNWSIPMASTDEKFKFSIGKSEQAVEGIEGEGVLAVGQIPSLDASAIDIPYQGDKFSMTILLPNQNGSLNETIDRMSGFSFENIERHLTKQLVRVVLPKFQFYTISKPKEALVKSGVKDIFEDSADLSGITGEKDLYLDDLVQLVTLDVDENQSSNIQLTAAIVPETRSSHIYFKADHPFVFVIRNKLNGVIVVAGTVKNPSTSHNL